MGLALGRSTPPVKPTSLTEGGGSLVIDDEILYTDCAPDAKVLDQFKSRNDNQIATLEMLAIAYGASASDML